MSTSVIAGPRPAGALALPLAFQNRRFRLLLLLLAGIPLAVGNLSSTLLAAAFDPGYRAGDYLVYIHAARALSVGGDPYATFLNSGVPDATLNQGYIYPPLLAWALQPLAHLSDYWATVAGSALAQLLLVAFVLLLRPLLRMRSWEATAWLYVGAIAWYPARANLSGVEVNLVILVLLALFVLLRGGVASGIALGATVAIKFLTAPLLGLVLLRRRWAALAAALAAVVVLWAISAPGWLPEYFSRVLPQIGGGTGFRENLSLSALAIRLLDPISVYGGSGHGSTLAYVLGLGASLALIAWTGFRLGLRAPSSPQAFALEASAVVALAPLIATLAWPSHLVLLLLPLSVVAVEALRAGDRAALALAGGGWVLLGPLHTAQLYAIAFGLLSGPLLAVAAETGVLGCVLVLASAIRALRFR